MAPETPVCASVVIPCYNAAEVVGRQLSALRRQQTDFKWEIVVADNGSTDDLAQKVAEYAAGPVSVTMCDASARRGINHARNAGAQRAGGRLILLCDADDQVADGWLAEMVAALVSGATLVGGRLIRVAPDQTPLGLPEDGLRNDLSYLPWPQGANCGFTREVYDELGGFDERYRGGGDETDFFWRAQLSGHVLAYVPRAAVLYTQRPDTGARFRQHYRYGRSHVQLFKAFSGRGMPRTSALGALRAWLTIVRGFLIGVRSPNRRRLAVAHLGQRCGRIVGSLALRVWYP
jgi:glycosyltransferase involved in cell wall biosynthesis